MNEIKRARVVVAANFTVETIKDVFIRLGTRLRREDELIFAPYNQIYGQLLDPGGLFSKNTTGVNIIFLRLEDLVESREGGVAFVRDNLTRIEEGAFELARMLGAAERLSVPLYVFICPASAEIRADQELAIAFDQIAKQIRTITSQFANLFIFPCDRIAERYFVDLVDNPRGNALGHVPYTSSYMDALAVETLRVMDAKDRSSLKVLVLDCDNTIWDGIVGEDGADGVVFSENRLFLQDLAVKQTQMGMVVCLNSRNNEADVWEVFDKRQEMILKKTHIVSARINWLPKSDNLKSIADELQLGLNSFIFIDDDPAVCQEVRTNCPEALTVLVPSDPVSFRGFFDHLWVLDKLTITKEDQVRTQLYQEQAVRRELLGRSANMNDFLASLELVCEISELKSEEIPRASQLTQRTNQFNSTTIRLSENDVRELFVKSGKTLWTVKVRDRFGDYGLVGVIIFEELPESISVESFLLSCRVLGRGVEHQLVRELGKRALAANRTDLTFNFVPTAKNAPVKGFFDEFAESNGLLNGQVVYTVDAQRALDCAPGQNLISEPDDPATTISSLRNEVSSTGTESLNRLEIYLEIARELSTHGCLSLETAPGSVSRESLLSEFCSAETPTEKVLTKIWEHALKTKNIGILDNFFEIGGDSLIAVALFVEIEEKFGRCLPISTLLESPTIQTLSRAIDLEGDSPVWKYLVPIQTLGPNPPLFCMHAAGGNVLFYRDLANGLGLEQPVYGLQARGIADKSETAHDRIEDMAEEYLKEIRQFQPNGPYALCGSSFGGLVAFECAKQLVDSGEMVSNLAVFDTYAPEYLKSHLSNQEGSSIVTRFATRLRSTSSQLRKIGTIQGQIAFLMERVRKMKNLQKRKLLWKKNEFAILYNKATGRELPDDLGRNHKAIQKAEATYRPEPYRGNLLLIRASDQPKGSVDPLLGWTKFIAGEIATEEVKGTHGAIAVNPSAVDLAAKLKYHIDSSQTSFNTAPSTLARHATAN